MASAHRSVAFFHFLKPETLISLGSRVGRRSVRLQTRVGKRREGSSGPLVLWNAETAAAAAAAAAENVESNLEAEKKERREGRKDGAAVNNRCRPSVPFHAGGGRQHKFARIF